MIVIDTHVLIWFFQQDLRIGPKGRDLIEQTAIDEWVGIPAICSWEIALIERRRNVPFDEDCEAWLRAVLNAPGFDLIPLTPAIAIESVRLDWSHRDPSDRMIVATARQLNAPLITADGEILAYAAAGHLQAIDARL